MGLTTLVSVHIDCSTCCAHSVSLLIPRSVRRTWSARWRHSIRPDPRCHSSRQDGRIGRFGPESLNPARPPSLSQSVPRPYQHIAKVYSDGCDCDESFEVGFEFFVSCGESAYGPKVLFRHLIPAEIWSRNLVDQIATGLFLPFVGGGRE